MPQHLLDGIPPPDVPLEHAPHEVDALLGHDEGHAQVAVHDLVDAVEGVFLVDDGVEEDAQRPDVLLLAVVGLSGEDLGGGVVLVLVSIYPCGSWVK